MQCPRDDEEGVASGGDPFDPIGVEAAHYFSITRHNDVPRRFNFECMKTSLAVVGAVRAVLFSIVRGLGREAGIKAIMVFNREKASVGISGKVEDDEIAKLMDDYSLEHASNPELPCVLQELNKLRFKLSLSVYFQRRVERLRFGDYESAEAVYVEAKRDLDLFFTIFFFTEWLKKCATFDQIRKVHEYLNQERVAHDFVFYTEWMKKTRSVEERIEVYERMIGAGITPDDRYFSAWIPLVESPAELSAVLDEVVRHDISPSVPMGAVILSFADRFGMVEEVAKLIAAIMAKDMDCYKKWGPLYRALMRE